MKLKTASSPEGFPVTIGGSTITVNPMSASQMGNLRKKHTTITRGVEHTDGVEMSKEMFDRIVLGWDDTITDEHDSPLLCTTANKRLVYEHNSGFAADVMAEMDRVETHRRKSEEGNSQPGPSGTSDQAK